MGDGYDERKWFFNRRTDKTIISKRVTNPFSGQKVRIASHIVDGQPGLAFATVKDEVVLRHTTSGRYEIKGTFLEDDRSILSLTIQRYSSSGPHDHHHFSFVGREIETLISFIAGIKTVPLEGEAKRHVSDEALRDIVLDQGQARRIFAKYPDLFLRLAQQEDITRDLVAVGYRRKQLQRFDRLLLEPNYFTSEQERLQCGPEAVWQKFFEANTWIFGYGLTYQFLSQLDERKLEQIVRGRDLSAAGKRSDAIMKTRGIISSLCFVEIKRHDAALLGGATPYRPDVWSPSAELVGGVSQVQMTVHTAIEFLVTSSFPETKLATQLAKLCTTSNPVRASSSALWRSFKPTEGSICPSSAPLNSTEGTHGDQRLSLSTNSLSEHASSLSTGRA